MSSITVEIMLNCFFQWLGGGSNLEIRLCAGISPASLYSCIYKCIDAVLNSEEMAYTFPETSE